jgi:WD40 repeat protein/serine/threonine protein kinase
MMKCPQCGKSLDVVPQRPGYCSACGAALPADLAKVTLMDLHDTSPPSAAGNETLDVVPPLPAAPPASGNVTLDIITPVDLPQLAKAQPTQANVAATIDSWTPAEPQPTPADARNTQTLDLDSGSFDKPAKPADDTGFSISPPERENGSLTSPDRRIAQTIDSHEISIDIRQVTGIWSKTYSPDTKPSQTIKGADTLSPRDSKLVIKPRAIKSVTNERPTGIDYELLGIIGEGGMGVVYSARQASIDRAVAIKMLKPEASGDIDRREKFLSEAVVTGELDHPNIVPIYDLGANEQNALFYSMKRVQGTPWSTAINNKSLAENLDILMRVADAVGFAHARGVVHRDLKPENVMLGEYGEVLVMDWGLALSTPTFRKSDSVTQSTSMGGTPAYMAPEMAMGPIDRVGPPADVYLLGAILYEIIAHKPPHGGATVMTCLHAAAQNQIQPTDASGELLDVALQAMATRPEDRYASVRDFQNAVRDYQNHSESIAMAQRAERDLAEAIESDDYQRFARALFAFEEALAVWDGNDRARVGVVAARLAYARSAHRKGDYDLAISLLTGDDAEQQELKAQAVAAAQERDARQGRLRNAKRLLAALAALVVFVVTGAYFQIRADRDRAVTAQKIASEQRDLAETARAEEARQKLAADDARAIAEQKRKDEAAARRDAELARAAADQAKEAEEYEAYVARIGLAAAKIEENSFDYAEQLLAECPAEYRNWEWGRLMFLCQQGVRKYRSQGPVDAVAFSLDGKRLISGSWDGTVRIWNTDSGDALHKLDYGSQYVHGVAWSPQGNLVAAAGNDAAGGVKIWNAETGELQSTLAGHADAVLSVAFSRDGTRLLSTSYDNTARLWDVATGRELRKFVGHSWWVWSAAFSPDESQVATASQDGTVRIWNVASSTDETVAAPAVFTGHRGPVYSVAFSHDGKQVASGGYDNRVLLWDPALVRPFDFKRIFSGEPVAASPHRALEGHLAAVRCVQFSADDKMIASAGHDNTVRVWVADKGKPIKILRGHAGWVRSCAFSPDGNSILSASHDHDARLWSIAAYEEMRILRARVLEGHDDAVLAAAFNRDGAIVGTASRDRTAKTWDAATGDELNTFREGHEFLASSAVISADGKRLLTAAIDNTTRMWDVATGAQQFVLAGTGRSAALALSPDGKLVLTGSTQRNAQLWNAADGTLLHTLDELQSEVTAVAFAPDGAMFATGDVAGRIRLWDTATRKQLWAAGNHNGRITALAFTPDGSRLLSACVDRTVGQWQADTGNELLELTLKHPDAVTSLSIDPRGKFVVTSCADNRARVWSLEDASLLGTLEIADAHLNAVVVSPDGTKVLTVGDLPVEPLPADEPNAPNKKLGDRRPLVRIWDLGSGKPLGDLQVRGTQVWASAFTPDGTGILTVGGNDARLWDVATGVQRMSFSPHGAVASVSFSPDGARLVTASWDNSARVWNVATGKSLLKLKDAHAGAVNSAMFSPDGATILTAGDDKLAKLWTSESADLLQTYTGHTDRVRSAVFSTDGNLVLTASNDKTARIWNAADGTAMQTLTGHQWAVTSAVFNADATRVLTGSEDKSAKLWDATTGQCLLTLQGHTAPVASVALSPDGSRALTASQDNICKLWDTRTGKEILTLKGHTQELTSASFSTDGRNALTTSRDGTAIIWLTAPWATKADP